MTRKDLEKAAIRAHAAGMTWGQFWPTIAEAVAAAEPWDNAAYRRLVCRLSHLLTCGNTDGVVPVPATWGQPEPWELDDQAQAVPVLVTDDTTTAARLLWSPSAEIGG